MELIQAKRSAEVAGLSLPPMAVVGIAVGGAFILFGTLTTIAVVYARRRNRMVTKHLVQGEPGETVRAEIQRAACPRPPEASVTYSKQLSFNPFMPSEEEIQWNDWTGEDEMGGSPRRKYKRLSAPKGSFRISAVRDSWPLVPKIPLSFIPDRSSKIQINNVAAPGYEVFAEPKWPKRIDSRNSRTIVLVPRDVSQTGSHVSDPDSPSKSPTKTLAKRGPHVRSASENHLTTILRSTSQRLKQTNKTPLTGTLANPDTTSAGPPLQPPPTLPNVKPSESREPPIDSDYEGSVASSVYEFLRSPSSPKSHSPQRSVPIRMSTFMSPTSSLTSDDSLCTSPTPDLVVPESLTSPSKYGMRNSHKSRMRVSSSEGRDLSESMHKDNRLSTSILGTHPNLKRSQSLAHPKRASLSVDPFSASKSPRTSIREDRLLGPRPLSIRKTTFGTERLSQRPLSHNLPLQRISGNAQGSPKMPGSQFSGIPSNGNPFQWTPQEAMQMHRPMHSPTRRKGHNRSKFVRISQVPRPLSINTVEEEPERVHFPLRFTPLAPESSTGVNTSDIPKPLKPKSPLRKSHQQFSRPPSVATFNPSLTDLTRSGEISPTIEMQDIMTLNSNVYSSPTLARNYYTESPITSEEEFFAHLSGSPVSPSRSHNGISSRGSRRHSRTLSADRLFPSSPQQGRIVSFCLTDATFNPQLLLPTEEQVGSAPSSPTPAPTPLPQTSTIYSNTAAFSPASIKRSSGLSPPLAPMLTMTIPGHLTGPRAEPTKRQSTESTDYLATPKLSPPVDSLQTSICMLRRMNSEISPLTSLIPPRSPARNRITLFENGEIVPSVDNSLSKQGSLIEQSEERRVESRGSTLYFNMGSPSIPAESSKSSASFLLPIISTSQVRSQAPRQRLGTLFQRRLSSINKRDVGHQFSKDLQNSRRRQSKEVQKEGDVNIDKFLKARGLVSSLPSPDLSGKDSKKRRGKAKVVTLTPVKEICSPDATTKTSVPTILSPCSPDLGLLPGMGMLNFGSSVSTQREKATTKTALQDPTLPSTGSSASSPNLNFPLSSPQSPPPSSTITPGLGQHSQDKRTKEQMSDLQGETSGMTSMMAVGELDDFFALGVKDVDHNTFAIGYGSESDGEDEDEFAFEEDMSGQILPALPSPVSPVLQKKPSVGSWHSGVFEDGGTATQRSSVLSREENDLLDLYRRSPCPTTPTFSLFPPTTINPHAPAPARWSDANPNPPVFSTATRRDSQLKHPLPKSSSAAPWVWQQAGLGLSCEKVSRMLSPAGKLEERNLFKLAVKERRKATLRKELRGEKVKVAKRKNQELGDARTPMEVKSLYDEEGFYRSPEREAEEGKKDVGDHP